MSKELGIMTSKGFHDNVSLTTSTDVPIGSIVLTRCTGSGTNVLHTKEATFYFSIGQLLPRMYGYEKIDDVPTSDVTETISVSGTWVLCGQFQDPSFETGSGAVTYMRIWQRIA